MAIDEREVGWALLKKLYDMGCWGKHHVCESNLPKGFPSDVRGRVKDAAEKLRKEKLLVRRPSSHDYQWYLNFEMREEIERRIRQMEGRYREP